MPHWPPVSSSETAQRDTLPFKCCRFWYRCAYAITSDAVPDFISTTPRPWIRSSTMSPDHGSRSQLSFVSAATGKTSMCPFRTTRGPGPRPPWNSLTMLGCPACGSMMSKGMFLLIRKEVRMPAAAVVWPGGLGEGVRTKVWRKVIWLSLVVSRACSIWVLGSMIMLITVDENG